MKTESHMFKEFKEFAMRGNVVDMAVGIVIGGAFGTIVKSLVDDVLMPPIGLLLGGVDFSDFFVVMKEGAKVAAPYHTLADAKAAGAVTLNLGLFVNSVISFTIMAFALFMLVKVMNKLRMEKAAAPAEATTKSCPHCCTDIPIQAKRCPHCTSDLG
jgi:large conductance mechanosensitive channel